jgi:hypothetical protein
MFQRRTVSKEWKTMYFLTTVGVEQFLFKGSGGGGVNIHKLSNIKKTNKTTKSKAHSPIFDVLILRH